MLIRTLFIAAILSTLSLFCVDAAENTDTLTYLLHKPTIASEHPPALILLHGRGADEKDLIGLWSKLPQNFVVVSPRAPFANDFGGYRWYEGKVESGKMDGDQGQVRVSHAAVDSLADDVIKRTNADPKKIFLAGFSQGAVMVYQVALQEPGRFRGAAVLSGSIFPSEQAVISAKTDRTHDAFFVAHGTADDRIAYSYATEAKDILAALAVPTEFHTYEGMRHEIRDAEISDLSAWLEKSAK
ncbi:MAG TPA: PHB depolymerase family esterase [Afipia sp.]